MTDKEFEDICKVSEGFHGTFVCDPPRTLDRGVGLVADYVDLDSRLVYVPEGYDINNDYDECHVITDEADDNVMEALAEMLNAVPKLIQEVQSLRSRPGLHKAGRSHTDRIIEELEAKLKKYE